MRAEISSIRRTGMINMFIPLVAQPRAELHELVIECLQSYVHMLISKQRHHVTYDDTKYFIPLFHPFINTKIL